MMSCYWYYFCNFCIFYFFQIIMVSLSIAWHDQHFIMFKNSNVFEFSNFPFKTKYNNTIVYSVNKNYLLSRGKQKKNCWNNSLIKSSVYLLIFRQNSMIFKGSPNSLKESSSIGELRLGESYFTGELGLGGVLNLGTLNSPLHRSPMFCKLVVLKNFGKSQKKTCNGVSFDIKL